MNKACTIFSHNYVSAILLFLSSLLVYLLTLAPTISWGDSAEFITVAYTLGIAHPSGYPLYTMLGKLFTFLPIGSVAFRVNLMSAVIASLTVVLVFFVTNMIAQNKRAGVLASLILAFSFIFWAHAVRAEVYGLNALFLAIILFIIVKYDASRNIRLLYLLAFIYGLSFTNHLITIILAVPLALFILIKKDLKFDIRILKPKTVVILVMLFVAGLLPYLYLPIRSSQNPVIDWGNPETLSNMIKHLTGEQYRNRMFELSGKKLMHNVIEALYFLILQFTVFLGFSIIGAWKIWHLEKRLFLFFSLIIIFNFLIAINYNIADIIVYYIPTYLIFSIFISIGLCEILKKIVPQYQDVLIILSCIIIIVVTYSLFKSRIDNHDDYAAYKYADFVFNVLPRESIIFTETDDQLFPLWYMQEVKQKRNDIMVISKSMLPVFWYMDMLKNQYPNLALKDYDVFINEFIEWRTISKTAIPNISYATDLFEEYAQQEIISLNRNKSRIFKIGYENVSDIIVLNKSIIKEI